MFCTAHVYTCQTSKLGTNVDGNAPVLSRKEKRELKRAAKKSKRESSRDQAKRDAAEASSNEISPATSCIVAASQQSRFYSATFDD
ncbi:hypothetical protein GQ600_7355 [Phytophthora cactorum]|nr:hypothetical protein GQ600_7355 [Phytophthora cactorum]